MTTMWSTINRMENIRSPGTR